MKRIIQISLIYALLSSCASEDPEKLESISGSCFRIENNVLQSYNCNDTIITLPSEITAVGDNALSNQSLTSVVFPENLQRIGVGAFKGNSLESVDLPESVEEIGQEAFAGNGQLELVHVPHDNPEVGQNAFPGRYIWGGTRDECFNIEVENDGDIAIMDYRDADHKQENCPKEVEVPKGITEIKERAFANDALTDVELPETVDKIGEAAFEGNGQLELVHVPHDNPEVGQNAFPGRYIWGGTRDECFNIEVENDGDIAIMDYRDADHKQENCPKEVEVPKGITEIKERAFANDALMDVELPETVDKIGEAAFEGNGQLELVHVPHDNPEVGQNAFPGRYIWGGTRDECFNIEVENDGDIAIMDYRDADHKQENCPKEVEVPKGITEIKERAFANDALTDVELPETVDKIGEAAFEGNGQLELVHVPHDNPEVGQNAFPGRYIWGGTRNDGCFDIEIENDGDIAFKEYRVFDDRQESCPKDVEIPYGITEIKERAFADYRLTNLELPETVDKIGEGAFEGNDELELVYIPHDSPDIGVDAFDGSHYIWGGTRDECFNIEIEDDGDIAISEYRERDNKQENCPRDVEIPYGITEIKERAFADDELTDIKLPDTVNKIGDGAFEGNDQVEVVHVPNIEATVGEGAFPGSHIYGGTRKDCFAFDPNNNMKITDYRNSDSKGRACPRSVEIPKGLSQIGQNAFQNKGLTDLVVLDGIIKIEDSAFSDNVLTSVGLPESLTNIGNNAFTGNANLGLVHVPSTTTNVATNAFSTPYIQGGVRSTCFNWSLSNQQVTIISYKDTDDYGQCPKELTIPRRTTNIASNAFRNKGLANVVIPESVTDIGVNAFIDNTFTTITLPPCVTYDSGQNTNSFDSIVAITQSNCPAGRLK